VGLAGVGTVFLRLSTGRLTLALYSEAEDSPSKPALALPREWTRKEVHAEKPLEFTREESKEEKASVDLRLYVGACAGAVAMVAAPPCKSQT